MKESRVKKVDVSIVYLPHQQLPIICLVDVFVKRPKPCDLIPYPLYLSLHPLQINTSTPKKKKKSDPTRPAAINAPFSQKKEEKGYNSLSPRNKQYLTEKKKASRRGNLKFVPLRYK